MLSHMQRTHVGSARTGTGFIRALVALLAAIGAGMLLPAANAQPSGASAFTPPPNGPRRADSTWVALRDATIHVSPTQTIEHGTIVMRDGRIMAILPGAADGPAPRPIGPRVVECAGLHVYPSFIEMHADVAAATRGEGQAANGLHWNTFVNPQYSALDGAGLDAAGAESLRKLGFGAAAISPRTGIIRGRSAVVSLAKAPDEASAEKPPVYASNAYMAMSLDPGARGGYPGSQMGSIALMRQTLLDADWQLAERMAGRVSGPTNAMDYLALAKGSQNVAALPVRPGVILFDVSDELEALRAAKIAREFSRPMILLGSGREFARLEAIRKDGHAIVLPLNFQRTPDVSSVGRQQATDLRDLMMWEQSPTNPRRVHSAGISFALTTAKLRDKGQFTENLRKAIRYGLPEQAALEALTTVPAKMLGIDADLGTLDVGKRANVLVATGPIFDKKTKLRAIYIDGVPHELSQAPESLAGTWDVQIPGAPEAKRSIVITREGDITIHRNDKSVKATRVQIEKDRIGYSFDHEPLDGQIGIYVMSGVVERTPSGAPVSIIGQGLRANGERFSWSATRREDSLEGNWVILFDDANVDSHPLVADDTNRITFLGAGPDADGKPPSPDDVKWDGRTLTYSIGTGGAERASVEAVVDFEAARPSMKGAVTAGGQKYPFVAQRFKDNPLVGSWRVTRFDEPRNPQEPDVAKRNAEREVKEIAAGQPDQIIIDVSEKRAEPAERRGGRRGQGAQQGEDNKPEVPAENKAENKPEGKPETKPDAQPDAKPDAKPDGKPEAKPEAKPDAPRTPKQYAVKLTFKKKDKPDVVIECEKVELKERTLTFTHSLEKLGAEGTSTDTITLFRDELHGESVRTSGDTISYIAKRVDPDADDEPAPTDIPEKLPTPFGPYGFDAYPAQGTFLITNATVWTQTDRGNIADSAVLIRDGKIAYVGPAAGAPSEGAVVIDAKGRHITPGIIDCHSHTGISRGVNEGGQAVTSEVRIEDVTNPDAISWYRQLAGGVTAVNNLHGSANAIGGQSQTNKNRWGASHPDDLHFEGAAPGIKFALGENPRQVNGGGSDRYPQTRMGVETLIRDRFTAAKEYAAAMKSAASGETPRRDLELDALAEILAGTRLIHCHSYRQDEIVMLTQVARDFGFKIGTFQHILEGYKVADYVRDYSGGGSGFTDWWAYKVEVQDAIPGGLPLMQEVGVTTSFNSDSDELARRLNVEAAKAIKYSNGRVSPEEAFKFVSLNAAKQLKVDQRVGTIEVGKDADIAVWSDNPLSPYAKCERTFVDGRQLFSLEQDAAARETIKKERARLMQKVLADGKRRSGGDSAEARSSSPDAPAGGPPGQGRRRRAPDGAAAPGATPPSDAPSGLSDEEVEILREQYLNMLQSGRDPLQAPGVCGCGLIHSW